MNTAEAIELKRDCEAIEIPSGIPILLTKGSKVRITQSLGTGYTIMTEFHAMYRIEAKDADALGVEMPTRTETQKPEGVLQEQMVWDVLKTIYDPEIPVNVVDLGLIYSCEIAPHERGGKQIAVKMSMTAPGCGMGNILKADIESRLSQLPEVKETHVEIVLDPPWNPGRMSEAAKLQLGFDLDYGSTSGFPIMR